MTNFGLLSRSLQSGGSSFNANALWKHSFTKGEDFHIIPLMCPFIPNEQEPEKPTPISFKTHYQQGAASSLCDTLYSDNTGCEECGKTKVFKGKEIQNYPSKVLTFGGYVIESIGVTRTSQRGTTYEENPEKIIEIPSGKSFINWAEFREVFDEVGVEGFLNTIFRIKRIDGGFMVKTVTPEKLGDQATTEAPQELRDKWSAYSLGEQIGQCVSVYSNVKWKHPDFVDIIPPAPVADESSDEDVDSEAGLEEDPEDM